MDKDATRTKYSDSLLNDFEYWLANNSKVRDNPSKDPPVRQKDTMGQLIRDDHGNYVRVQKKLLTVSPRELHQFMIEDFPPASVDGQVIITEPHLRKTLKRS